jgi:hypothetical protein
MIKEIAGSVMLIWKLICFSIRYILPIRDDVIRICQKAKELGLDDKAARERVFQDITDCLQARGILKNYPDPLINTIQEAIYLFYIWKKGETK